MAKSAKDTILAKIRALGSQKNIDGMNRFGILCAKKLGVTSPELKQLAKGHKRNHELALELWKTGIHEAMILAAWIDDKKQVTEAQMDDWVQDIDCWAVCDTVCGQLFDRTPFAEKKAYEWVKDDREFVRRAGIVLMTWLAVHDKKADDGIFEKFFPVLKKYATDERNFVKKAVNWAIRQFGKRNKTLLPKAIKLAQDIQKIDSKAARWIAAGAIRELESRKAK
ncbi:MAG: DNA alkylation repair protein [Candidatus Gracilibacteria bacterium]